MSFEYSYICSPRWGTTTIRGYATQSAFVFSNFFALYGRSADLEPFQVPCTGERETGVIEMRTDGRPLYPIESEVSISAMVGNEFGFGDDADSWRGRL